MNANYLSTIVSFEYGIDLSYGKIGNSSQSPIVGNTNTKIYGALDGLLPGTVYHSRVKTVNSLGTIYGNDMTFTTLGQAPSAISKPATSISSTTAILNETVNANYLSTVITFEYGTTLNYGNSITAIQSPVTGNSSTNVNANISELMVGTSYQYRVKAVNSLGTTFGNDLNKLTDNDDPIPITHICKPERLGKKMTGLELHEFGLSLFMTFLWVQDGKLIAVIMNPEDGAPNIVVENPQKLLLHVWVKTDLAPIIPVHERNETHDAIVEASRKYGAKPCFASITIISASKEGNLIPKCGGEYYAVLNEFERI